MAISSANKRMKEINDRAEKTTKALEASAKATDKLADSLNGVNKTLGNVVDKEAKVNKGLKESKTEAEAFAKSMNDVNDVFGSFGKILKGAPGGFRDLVKQAGAFGAKFKESAGLLGKMGGLAAGLSKALSPVVGVAGLIWDTVTSIDSYVKDLNKKFAEIRGPDIMSKDVKKQMKEFNSAIFDISSNLRDGLNAKEVYNFFDAINAAGQKITTLNQGFYSYRDAVHIAAKASKVFGMSLDATARYMASFGTDYQMQLEDIDDAFVQVAFDASKSGLSTDRFMTAVTNASASLAFYGKFLKESSNTMKAFTDAQVTGADEAAQTTGDLLQLFKKTSSQGNMAFASIAANGGASLKKLFKNAAKRADEEAAQIKEKIQIMEVNQNPADAEAIDKLRKQLVAAEQRSARAQHAGSAGIVAMGQDMAMLAGETPELMLDLISGINGLNFSTTSTGASQLAAIKGVEKLTGMSEGSLRTIIMSAQAQVGLLKDGLTSDKGLIQGLNNIANLTGDDVTTANELVDGIDKLNQDSPSDTIDQMSTTMSNLLKMDEGQAKSFLNAASVNEDAKGFLQEQLKLARSGKPMDQNAIMKKYDEMIHHTDLGKDLFKKQLTTTDKASKTQKSAYDDQFKQLTDNTLSLSDMQKIISEGVGYQTASLLKLQDISAGITGLVRHFVGQKEVRNTGAEAARATMSPALAAELKAAENTGAGGAATVATKYVKQKDEATIKISSLDSISEQLAGIQDKATAQTALAEWNKKMTKKGDKNITKADKETTAYLSDLANNGLTGQAFQKDVINRKAEMIKNKAIEIKKLADADDSLKKLNAIDASSETMATIMASEMTDDQTAKLYDMLKDQALKEGKKSLSWQDVQKKVGVGELTHKMFDIAQKRGEKGALSGAINTSPTATTTPTDTKSDVLSVMRGGMVNVKNGDVVVDKNSLAQVLGGGPGAAIPFLKSGAAMGGTTPGGGGDITITVNANEKDLGDRIANEIKGALYQMHVKG